MKQIEEKDIQTILTSIDITPDAHWVKNTREQIISKMNVLDQNPKQFNFLHIFYMRTKVVAVSVIAAVVVIASVGAVTVQAAKGSKAGDFLFGLDKSIENFERTNINDPVQLVSYENEVMRERLTELDELKQDDSPSLVLGIQEVSEQQDRLTTRLQDCTDCDTELEQEADDLINSAGETANQIRTQAQIQNNSELESEALKLENKAQEHILEVQKQTLEQIQEQQKTKLELQQEEQMKAAEQNNASEQERQQLELQQEQEKQQLEQQQEQEKQQLEQQQEAQKKTQEQEQEHQSETEDTETPETESGN